MDLRETLKQELHGNKNYKGRNFLPPTVIEKLITRQTTSEVLGDIDEKLAGRIARDASRVFAILVLIEREYHVFNFLDKHIDDKHIPIDRANLPPFETEDDQLNFFRLQFCLPPVFERNQHLELSEKIVLPFLECSNIDNGSFGYVYRVVLRPGQLSDSQHNVVALKSVTKGEGDSWPTIMREAETLRKRSHPHIIQLLASFTVTGIESGFESKILKLIFPYAEMNMEVWMNLRQTPQHLQHLEREEQRRFLYQSMYSLVSALSYLHRELDGLITSHHDLKPKNVLLLGDTLKLADLGRSHLVSLQDGSASEGPRGTYTYHPPEYYNNDGSRAIVKHGRAFDAWSMGCILTEMATLVVYGWKQKQYIKAYQKRRQLSPQSRKLNSREIAEDESFHNHIEEVHRWITELKEIDGSRVLAKCLQIAEAMLTPMAQDRLFLWEAELDFFELLHPDNPRMSRLEKGALCVQSPGPMAQMQAQTPLHRAVQSENRDRIEQLINVGWSPYARDRAGVTPIKLAQATRSTNVGVVLLESSEMDTHAGHQRNCDADGADEDDFERFSCIVKTGPTNEVLNFLDHAESQKKLLSQANEDGLTPLHWAARFASPPTIKLLLKKCEELAVAVDTKDNWGNTPLHDAFEGMPDDVISALLRSQKDCEQSLRDKGSNGRTPLHCAAIFGNRSAAEALLTNTANPSQLLAMEDDNGATPLRLAVKRGHVEVVELLRTYVKTELGVNKMEQNASWPIDKTPR